MHALHSPKSLSVLESSVTAMFIRREPAGQLIDLGVASVKTRGATPGTKIDPVPMIFPKIYLHGRFPD
jgi:hypothetical protein